MSASGWRWYATGMVLSVLVGTGITMMPFRAYHMYVPPVGARAVNGLLWFVPFALVSAIPMLALFYSWSRLVNRRLALLETHAAVRWIALTAIGLLLPRFFVFVGKSIFWIFGQPVGFVDPWIWHFPFGSIKLEAIWIMLAAPLLAWLLLPRLLIPSLRGPLLRREVVD